MPDKLLKDGLRTSEKIGGVSEFAELLFLRLIIATCHAGRCPWNPDWIRSHALPNRRRKRLAEIAAGLEELRRAHLVTRYTGPDGTAYLLIPNHGQRLSYRVRSPWPAPPSGPPDAEGQTILALPGAPPEKKPEAKSVSESPTHFTSLLSSPERKGRRGEGKPAARPRLGEVGPAADLRPAASALPELIARWPRHDVPAQLRAALRYVRKQRQDEQADITVAWFEQHWLPQAPEKKPAPPSVPTEKSSVRPSGTADHLAERRAALLAAPEPAPGTLDHALWLEARRISA